VFCETETDTRRLYGVDAATPYPKDGINDHVLWGAATVDPARRGTTCFDENEFLSPYGLRAISAHHGEHPYELDVEGVRASVDHEPAESTTAMFGERYHRPCFGSVDRIQTDPAWKDNLLFHEYFHGDDGAGLGANHQTGWTGIVADVIRRRHGVVPSVGDVLRSADPQRPAP
jgi:hypothetical protein